MRRIKEDIIKVSFTEDVFFRISSLMKEYQDPKQEHGYSMSNILNHYSNEAQGIHSKLRIDRYSGEAKFWLHVEDDNSKLIAIRSDKCMLEKIRQALEGQLQIDTVSELTKWLQESNQICNLYNNEFLTEIKNIITKFEDENELKGGCGLSYCRKKKQKSKTISPKP